MSFRLPERLYFMKKKIFLSLVIILSLLLGVGYLGLFDPEWKKYSLESPYVNWQGYTVSKKSDYTKINPFYEKMNIKGLIYDYSIKERIIEEGGGVSNEPPVLLCSIKAYSLDEQKENNILDYLNNEHINSYLSNDMKDDLSNAPFHFHINGEVKKKDEYYKSIKKVTHIRSNWIPANIMFAINAENIFDKTDNGVLVDKTIAKYPNQWKQLELCLQDMERKNGREFDRSIYIRDGRPLHIINEHTLSKYNKKMLKNKIKNTILSDKSFITISDTIFCNYNYDSEDFLKRYSHYYTNSNYEKYGKTFYTSQGSSIDIYNIDEKIYIRIFAKYMNGLPYIERYCGE